MGFENYKPEFVEIPEHVPTVSMSVGGDYTFNREGRLVPIDAPDAVSYVFLQGMRVTGMSDVDPEDEPLDEDEDLDIEEDEDAEDEGACPHGFGPDEQCPECDGDEEGEDSEEWYDDDLEDVDEDL